MCMSDVYVSDMLVEVPDKKSVMTYLMCMFQVLPHSTLQTNNNNLNTTTVNTNGGGVPDVTISSHVKTNGGGVPEVSVSNKVNTVRGGEVSETRISSVSMGKVESQSQQQVDVSRITTITTLRESSVHSNVHSNVNNSVNINVNNNNNSLMTEVSSSSISRLVPNWSNWP